MGYYPKSPEDVLVIYDDERDLKKEFFAIYGSLSASELKLTEKIDLMLSTSVLEHIRDLEQVIYHLSHPSTLHVHAIDAREHTSFHDPSKYLRYTEEEFLKLYTEEQNRTRLHEYEEVFKKVGLSVFQKKFIKPLPITESGNVDKFRILSDGIESFYVNDIEELPICVTEKERADFI